MAKRLISRADLARIRGVSRAAITKVCKGSLAPACVGKRIDLDHPAVAAYLAAEGLEVPRSLSPAPTKTKPERPAAAPRKKPTPRVPVSAPSPKATPAPSGEAKAEEAEGAPDAEPDPLEDIEAYAHLTLHELVERFGTSLGFRDWLDARKKIADIREKDLKNDETEGRLIAREFVRAHVFNAIESVNRRLLRDTPKTIARRVYTLAKSNKPIEEAEAVVREAISSQLRPMKEDAVKALRHA